MNMLEEEPRFAHDNTGIAGRDDDDDGNDLSEDMITRGKCLLKADHTTQHYCFLCASWF